MHPLPGKREEAKKNMALKARFCELTVSGGQRRAKFSEGVTFFRITMFFCKHVISAATLLLIIHITMYILISLI